MSENEKKELYNLLCLSYKDVKNSNDDFANILLKAIHKIDNGDDYKLLCTNIAPYCNNYLLKNIGKVSKNIVKLNELVDKINRTYRGKASFILNFF